MSQRPQKHSLTLSGHRTSVSLEPAFWQALQDMAAEKSLSVNALVGDIDASREADCGLATAIRLRVLAHFRTRD